MKRFLLLSLSIILVSNLSAQSPVGKISFTDGSTMEFYKLERFSNYTQSSGSNYAICVEFENTSREIPFSKMDYFEVNTWEKYTDLYIQNSLATVKTKTGVNIKQKFTYLNLLDIRIFDKLTGEMKSQIVYFAKDGKLLIKSVDFY